MSSTIVFNGTSYSIPAEGDSSWGTDLTNYLIAIASGSLQKTGGNFTLTADVNFGTNFGLKAQYLKSQGTNPASAGVIRLANAESIKWRNQANNADLDLTVNSSNVLQFNGSSILLPGIGSIVNADVNASAAIAYSKLNLASSIVNADISNSAAIAYSKLNLTGTILNADISASAAITYSKLNLATSIVNADISASAAIAYSKLNLATSIVNADINASAAIARSKLAALTASRVMVTDGSGFDSASSVTSTTLGYLDATSSVQTQLDAKVAKSTLTTKGDIYVATASATIARQGIGSDGQILVADSSQTNGLKWSTISGGVNYILNPGAEASTTGWATYADAAGTSPVDGTGGSPNSTWTRSTSSPLHGSGMFILTHNSGASRQGEGASYDFSIDAGDKAKVLQIEFDYQLVSGTFTAGSDSATSDLTVWIYDVTNSTLIQPSTYKLFSNSSTLPTKFVSNFQSAANSTSYRLIIHCGSTSTSAFVMSFDDFKVAPCNYVYGTPISDWIAFTPTGSWSSNTTYTGFYRRVGDTLNVKYRLALSGAPTSATLTLNLPTGMTIDTNKVFNTTNEQNKIGFAKFNDQGVDQYDGDVSIASSTTLSVFTKRTVTGSNPVYIDHPAVTQAVPFTWGNTDVLYAEADGIPILGWSASSQQSDSYDGRIIAASYSTSVGTSVNGTPSVIPFATKLYDTTNSWNGSDTYTIPSAGKYSINATLTYAFGSYTAGHYIEIYVFKNGSQVYGATQGASATASNYVTSLAAIDLDCNAGDTIQIKARNDATRTLDTNALHNIFTIKKIQSGATISATEVVAFMAEGASSSALGSNTVIPFNTPSHDTHAGWNSTNKDWAAPYSGYYKVFFQMRVTSGGTPSVNQYLDAIIQVDTVTKREFVKYIENTGVAGWEANVSWQGWLNAGQKIRAVGDTNITSPTLTTGSTHTFLEIFRIK